MVLRVKKKNEANLFLAASTRIIGGACDPDLSRWSDLRVTWKNGGLALCTKSRGDSHEGAAAQRRFVSAEIYSEIDISE
jgi:hypothetical protein